MRASQWLFATLKENPKEAEILSQRLMLRAGMIRKLGSGLYSWLPMGLRVLRKVEQVVREEMNRANALEILMPAVQPSELWQETGRWDSFGGQLLCMRDSNDREYCFGPTHEEVITDLMRQELQSYKQLPINLYQIQTKFRDEIRPRFGVMRAREFIMKDAYSFHLEPECLELCYQSMYATYSRIFDRLGLRYRAVEADTGAIGGSKSHEFQVLAEAGEDLLFYSDQSSYAANVEQATALRSAPAELSPVQSAQKIATPNIKTISDLSQFLNIEPKHCLKTLIVRGQGRQHVALVLRGDDELNPIKAAKHPWVQSPLELLDEECVSKELGLATGFIGPIGLQLPTIIDHEARALAAFVCGANQRDQHLENACWTELEQSFECFDLRRVQEGDLSPDGQGQLLSCRGIEVGHIFQLGEKYAKAMKAEVLDEAGALKTLIMGCYGLGISRVVAAAIEQHHDEKGILWPESMAPFSLVIVPIQYHKNASVQKAADDLYKTCQNAGIDVFLDDRNERPGVLFADHDLIGIPHRLVISEKLLAESQFEYKARGEAEARLITEAELSSFLETLSS